jgi:hypothetical protein
MKTNVQKKKRLPVRSEVQAVARQRCRSIREAIPTLRNALGLACSVEVALLSRSKRTNSIERVIRNNRNTKK